MKTEKKEVKMNNYQTKKEQARQKAIEWQLEISARHTPRRWGELWEEQVELEKLGKNYGLLKEFKENGIIWKSHDLTKGKRERRKKWK